MCTKMSLAVLLINGHEQEIVKILSSRGMDKQIVVHLYSGIPLGNKKEGTTDAQNDVEESPRSLSEHISQHHAKPGKPDTQPHVLCGSIYILPRPGITWLWFWRAETGWG